MPDIELASTMQLVRELQRRHTVTLFVFSRPNKNDVTNDLHSVYFSGSALAALGACAYANKVVLQEALGGTAPLDAEPPGDTEDDNEEGP